MRVKAKELRELTSEELATRRRDLKHEMINLRVQQQSGQLENPARIFLVRKEVAGIETVLSSRRLVPVVKAAAAAGAAQAPAPVKEEKPAAKKKAPAKKKATGKKKAPAKKKAAAKKKAPSAE